MAGGGWWAMSVYVCVCGWGGVDDWEEFQAIPGCVTTRHSTEDPGKAIALSDAQEEEKRAKEEAAAQATKPKLNSIEKYNDSNPEASTGAKSFGANTGANAKVRARRAVATRASRSIACGLGPPASLPLDYCDLKSNPSLFGQCVWKRE